MIWILTEDHHFDLVQRRGIERVENQWAGRVDLFAGGMFLAQWPGSSVWVLGTFFAIELIFQGWAAIALARAIRSTFDGVKSR